MPNSSELSRIGDLMLKYWRLKRQAWAQAQGDKQRQAYLQGQIDAIYKIVCMIGNVKRGKPLLYHVNLDGLQE